jgi:hypothetical protein
MFTGSSIIPMLLIVMTIFGAGYQAVRDVNLPDIHPAPIVEGSNRLLR